MSIAQDGDLDRLLETEQRLEAVVADARNEADRLLAQAGEAARSRADEEGAALRDAIGALEAELTAERTRRETEIAAAAREYAARCDAVTDAAVAETAQALVLDLFGGATP